MLEDSHGNLWICTDGGGVTRYNGETFTHFTEKEGLICNSVRTSLEDQHGNLWFGTPLAELAGMMAKTFTHFTERRA